MNNTEKQNKKVSSLKIPRNKNDKVNQIESE